jgi:hypothetical protein
MRELVDTLRDVRDGTSEPGKMLRDSALAWTMHAILAYRGKLLTRALAISAALAQFAAELEKTK